MSDKVKSSNEYEIKIQNALSTKEILDKTYITFICKASGTNVLYGSVDIKQIKLEIQQKTGFVPKRVELKDTIKTTGIYLAIVDIFEDIFATVKILVEKSEDDLRLLELSVLKGENN